jgi:uncharacterized membrane protein
MEKQGFFSKLGDHFRGTLIAGALIILPIAIVVGLLIWVFLKVEGFVRPVLKPLVAPVMDDVPPGLGVLAILIVVYAFGLIWRKRLGRRLIRTFQHYVAQIPIVGSIYGPARQLMDSMRGNSAAGFKRVVIVEYPRQGAWMVGFLTGITNVSPGTTMGVVYLPTAPMPQSGFVNLIPIQEIYDASMTVPEAMQMVLSGGISSPLEIGLKQLDPLEALEFLEQGGVAGAQTVNPNSGVFNIPFLPGGRDDQNDE